MIRAALALCVFGVWGAAIEAADCARGEHAGNKYLQCEVDLTREDLRLFLRGKDGAPYGHFSALNDALADEGLTLDMAMNKDCGLDVPVPPIIRLFPDMF